MEDGDRRLEPDRNDGHRLPGDVEKPLEGPEDMAPFIILGIILGAFVLGLTVLALSLLLA
ncbi:MAG TPA: hypothetical protein VMT52_07885 [Planctomycetota bacterium]|nr:hypothetical protein [Planctomycetota bacterium]